MNVHDYLTKQLRPGEELMETVRRHPVVMVPAVGGGGLLLLLDFFLVAWWFTHGAFGLMGFITVLFIGGWFIARGIYEWLQNVLIITNQRLIDINQRGFFNFRVAEATYEKIQDVKFTISGVWQTLWQFGSIAVQTAGANTTLDINGLRHPQIVQRLIAETQQRAVAVKPNDLTADELVQAVDRLRQHLGPDEFRRIMRKPPPTT